MHACAARCRIGQSCSDKSLASTLCAFTQEMLRTWRNHGVALAEFRRTRERLIRGFHGYASPLVVCCCHGRHGLHRNGPVAIPANRGCRASHQRLVVTAHPRAPGPPRGLPHGGRPRHLKGADDVPTEGDGPDRDAVESLALKFDVLDRVRIVGWVPPEDRFKWLSGADFIAMPSRYESFGMVAAEALAVETPVVAFDIPEATWARSFPRATSMLWPRP